LQNLLKSTTRNTLTGVAGCEPRPDEHDKPEEIKMGQKSKESIYEQARARMEELGFGDEQLDFIFADWPNMDEHLDWLMTASKAEITDWIESAK
jgi:hypothetical protein